MELPLQQAVAVGMACVAVCESGLIVVYVGPASGDKGKNSQEQSPTDIRISRIFSRTRLWEKQVKILGNTNA